MKPKRKFRKFFQKLGERTGLISKYYEVPLAKASQTQLKESIQYYRERISYLESKDETKFIARLLRNVLASCEMELANRIGK